MKPLLLILINITLFLPLFSSAQNIRPGEDGTIEAGQGFVPCEGASCGTCDIIVVANTGIKWLITISFLFFAVLAVKAGAELVISQGNAGALSKAKDAFTNAFIGLIIILVAWILVDTLLRKLLDGGEGDINGYGPWSQVTCTGQVDALTPDAENPYYEGDAEFVSGTTAGRTGAGGPGVTPTGELVAYGGRQFDSAVVDKIRYIDTNFNLTLTSGFRTEAENNAANGSPTSYHLSGRAADFSGSAEDRNRAADWARAQGAKEILIHDVGSGLHLHVAW